MNSVSLFINLLLDSWVSGHHLSNDSDNSFSDSLIILTGLIVFGAAAIIFIAGITKDNELRKNKGFWKFGLLVVIGLIISVFLIAHSCTH